MCCSALQWFAGCCRVLQGVAACCSVFVRIAIRRCAGVSASFIVHSELSGALLKMSTNTFLDCLSWHCVFNMKRRKDFWECLQTDSIIVVSFGPWLCFSKLYHRSIYHMKSQQSQLLRMSTDSLWCSMLQCDAARQRRLLRMSTHSFFHGLWLDAVFGVCCRCVAVWCNVSR